MSNPSNGVVSPRFAGTMRSDSQNVEQVNSSRKRNKFDYSNSVYDSYRFGEVKPFFHMRSMADDTITLNSKHELWTSVLKSPLLSDLTMYKDFFYVPYKALLPNSWDSFISTPVQGDDVPDDVYTYINLKALATYCFSYMYENKTAGSNTIASMALKQFFLGLEIFSSSGLLQQFGINVNKWLEPERSVMSVSQELWSFDAAIEENFGVPADGLYVSIGTKQYPIFVANSGVVSPNVPVIRRLIFDSNRTTSDISFNIGSSSNPFETVYSFFRNALVGALGGTSYNQGWKSSFDMYVDVSPIYAYQLVGSQFYVNDNVDKIFSAKDFISNIHSLMLEADDALALPTFLTYEYNGSVRFYDTLSAHYVNALLDYVVGNPNTFNSSAFGVLSNLFVCYESLRYGDYFSGSRLSPLAIGADSKAVAPVTSNEVSAVDITKSLAWQSFLNDVMKLGPVSWIQQNGIFGEFPDTLDPMPRFISRERCSIGEQQVENNSDSDTGNIVTRMRSTSGNYAFKVNIKEWSILLGLVSFDVPRIYQNVTERFAFTYDRDDFFNPYFQNIGDQAVYYDELALRKASPSEDFSVWSWQIRDTQWKQRVSVAQGAFVGNMFLPSWAFVDDNQTTFSDSINSNFVRNHNYDFDRFYTDLPNITFAGYFHFYIRWRNSCEAVRKMQNRPSIQLPLIHQ